MQRVLRLVLKGVLATVLGSWFGLAVAALILFWLGDAWTAQVAGAVATAVMAWAVATN